MKQPSETVTVSKKDLDLVLRFVLECWPNYEDEISWGDDMRGEDEWFYRAAMSLRENMKGRR